MKLMEQCVFVCDCVYVLPVVTLKAGDDIFGSHLSVKLYRHGDLGVQGGVNPDHTFTQLRDLLIHTHTYTHIHTQV